MASDASLPHLDGGGASGRGGSSSSDTTPPQALAQWYGAFHQASVARGGGSRSSSPLAGTPLAHTTAPPPHSAPVHGASRAVAATPALTPVRRHQLVTAVAYAVPLDWEHPLVSYWGVVHEGALPGVVRTLYRKLEDVLARGDHAAIAAAADVQPGIKVGLLVDALAQLFVTYADGYAWKEESEAMAGLVGASASSYSGRFTIARQVATLSAHVTALHALEAASWDGGEAPWDASRVTQTGHAVGDDGASTAVCSVEGVAYTVPTHLVPQVERAAAVAACLMKRLVYKEAEARAALQAVLEDAGVPYSAGNDTPPETGGSTHKDDTGSPPLYWQPRGAARHWHGSSQGSGGVSAATTPQQRHVSPPVVPAVPAVPVIGAGTTTATAAGHCCCC